MNAQRSPLVSFSMTSIQQLEPCIGVGVHHKRISQFNGWVAKNMSLPVLQKFLDLGQQFLSICIIQNHCTRYTQGWQEITRLLFILLFKLAWDRFYCGEHNCFLASLVPRCSKSTWEWSYFLASYDCKELSNLLLICTILLVKYSSGNSCGNCWQTYTQVSYIVHIECYMLVK